MGKWVIDKQFSFCYGHRVHTQELVDEYCERNDTQCKCRHLHGHEGLVHVFLEGTELTRGMVTDFKHLGWLKNFLDDTLDHKFILDVNDPMMGSLLNVIEPQIKADYMGNFVRQGADGYMYLDLRNEDDMNQIWKSLLLKPVYIPGTDRVVGWNIDVSELKYGPEIEVYEGYFLVNWVPTSENFCKWLFDLTTYKMSMLGIDVAQVDWYETPKSRSSYRK